VARKKQAGREESWFYLQFYSAFKINFLVHRLDFIFPVHSVFGYLMLCSVGLDHFPQMISCSDVHVAVFCNFRRCLWVHCAARGIKLRRTFCAHKFATKPLSFLPFNYLYSINCAQ
jgi:hypothetical protein